ncbi:unnamed protein product [Choristocarpus tenellus]
MVRNSMRVRRRVGGMKRLDGCEVVGSTETGRIHCRAKTYLYAAAAMGLILGSLPTTGAFVVPSVTPPPGLRNGAMEVNGVRRRTYMAGVSMVATGPKVEVDTPQSVTVTTGRTPGQEGPHLPWRQSVAGPEHPLNYMPFMEHMLNVLAESFGEMTVTPLADRLAFAENTDKKARILSMTFTCQEIRKVRLTYFDGGSKVQVLNAVIYPDVSLDLPILGIDLITFGKKHLAGMDFQPLFDDEAYRKRISNTLSPVKAKYPEFAQKMSSRFYDSAQFFSEEMLFGRYEDSSIITTRLLPAFKEYLSLYVAELKEANRVGGDPSQEGCERVLDRQRAYDQYNAQRDPAHGLFVNYFGQEWSDAFMDDFLFELSVRPEGGYPKIVGNQRGGDGGAPKQQERREVTPRQE